MRILICGSRSITDPNMVAVAVAASGFQVTHLISGGAAGADTLAERWATANGIPKTIMIPDWEGLGRRAGLVRNSQMLEQAEAVIAIWDSHSRGTLDTIQKAILKNLPLYIHKPKGNTHVELP